MTSREEFEAWYRGLYGEHAYMPSVDWAAWQAAYAAGVAAGQAQGKELQDNVWNLATATERERADLVLRDVASMCRRLSYALKSTGANDKLVMQCVSLLKKHGLGGSVLRANEQEIRSGE